MTEKREDEEFPPNVPKEKQTVLFIQGLDRRVNEGLVYETFEKYSLTYLKIAKDPITHVSLGYGFLGFRSRSKAEEALKFLNHIRLLNKTITLTWYNRAYDTYRDKPNLNIFVKNIPKTLKTEEFEEYFGQFGEIISARIIEGNNGESRGYGFVLYKEAECAAKAIKEANGKKLKDGTKNLIVCMFEKNRKKNPIKFNNIYVKNIPKEWTEDDVRNYFSKYGEISSMIVRLPDASKLKPTIPAEKRKEILEHKFAFVCYKSLDGPAEKAIAQVPYMKITDKAYNEQMEYYVNIFKLKPINEADIYKCACYVLEHKLVEKVKTSEGLEEVTKKFLEIMEEEEGYYKIMDKTDRLFCCRALKKKDRERKALEIFQKIKKRLREKYKFCNLYVKNLPENITLQQLKDTFSVFGPLQNGVIIRTDKDPAKYPPFFHLSRKVFAYICFFEQSDAVKAKQKLSGKPLFRGGPKLYVDYHQPREERDLFGKLRLMRTANRYPMQPQPKPEELKYLPQVEGMAPRTVRYLIEVAKLMNRENLAKQRYGKIYPDSRKRNDIYRYKLYEKLIKANDFFRYQGLFHKIIGILLKLSDYYLEKMLDDKMFLYGQTSLAIQGILIGNKKSPEQKEAEEKERKEWQKKDNMDKIDQVSEEMRYAELYDTLHQKKDDDKDEDNDINTNQIIDEEKDKDMDIKDKYNVIKSLEIDEDDKDMALSGLSKEEKKSEESTKKIEEGKSKDNDSNTNQNMTNEINHDNVDFDMNNIFKKP